jgi:hypothetical protein
VATGAGNPPATIRNPGDYALKFIGPGSEVIVPTLVRDDTGPITVEMQLQMRDSRGVVICIGGDAMCLIQPVYDQGGATLMARERSSVAMVSVIAPNFVPDNSWHHVAFVSGQNDAALFIDGHQVARREKHVFAKASPLKTGYRGTVIGSQHLQGMTGRSGIECSIYELRISKSVRYVKDFVPGKRFSPDKDTIALYHCDEGAGDILVDSSGHNHNGRIVGPQWVKINSAPTVASNGPTFERWIRDVAALPAAKQVEAIVKRLQLINPGFDGKETHKIEYGVVTEWSIATDNVKDISPIRALAGVKNLTCVGTGSVGGSLSDLSPLRQMKLEFLDCSDNFLSDLSPLQGMPLTELVCSGTQVSDLSPLKGMPLTELDCGGTQVSDLSPLKELPLARLTCDNIQVTDLSPLEGMPLTFLNCSGTQVFDLSPLKHCKPLTFLNTKQTKVTPAGIAAFQKSLPNCKIDWNGPDNASLTQDDIAKPLLSRTGRPATAISPISLTFEQNVTRIDGRDIPNDEQIVTVPVSIIPVGAELQIAAWTDNSTPNTKIVLQEQPEVVTVTFQVSKGKSGFVTIHIKPWLGPLGAKLGIPCSLPRLRALVDGLPGMIDNAQAVVSGTQSQIQALESNLQQLNSASFFDPNARQAAILTTNAHLDTQHAKLKTLLRAVDTLQARQAELPGIITQVEALVGTTVQFRVFIKADKAEICVVKSDPDGGNPQQAAFQSQPEKATPKALGPIVGPIDPNRGVGGFGGGGFGVGGNGGFNGGGGAF